MKGGDEDTAPSEEVAAAEAAAGPLETIVTAATETLPAALRGAYQLVRDVASYHLQQRTLEPSFVRRSNLVAQLNAAASYREYHQIALELDQLDGNEAWKMRFESTLYDYHLVHSRYQELREARQEDNVAKTAFLLRSTLLRNLGGIANNALYKNTWMGTKTLIEQYLDEVVFQLNYINRAEVPGMTRQEMTEMFVETRQAFGRSALLLSGGGGLGIHHFGVIKALFENNLLPRIISGSSIGSVIGALVCFTPDSELLDTIDTLASRESYLITREGEAPSWRDRIGRLLRYGFLADSSVLKDTVRGILGDITFLEAYKKTGRILNVTVNSTAECEIPRLLNYLTSPNVVVWSAVLASCALTLLFQPAEIWVKTEDGNMIPWNPPGQQWIDGSTQTDLPIQRLAELFNVNHYIVSQVNPHVGPLLRLQQYAPGIHRMVQDEAAYRVNQLRSFMPSMITRLVGVLAQPYHGDITIVPTIPPDDYFSIASNPTPERFARAIKLSQVTTYHKIAQIKNHLAIELALDGIVQQRRGCERWELS
eukprot:m.68530 g.68530  ORF g.68530 m.68530 type:complete len:538 (+) comp7749_c0_seq1:125-1738(+)